MIFNRKLLSTLILAMCLLFGSSAIAQTYLYFQDSPDSDFYDFSWMELTAPSELERKGDELRKFPVESIIPAKQGLNSLRLKWRSAAGGDWVAIAAGTSWEAKNLSETDTLMFWLYSLEGITAANLPKIFLEDINNVKTTKHAFASWSPETLPITTWVKISVPMSLFLTAGDPVDFTNIKTVGFAQNATDNLPHTLLVDDMRVFAGSGASLPASKPTGLIAEGYDSHIKLEWNANPETDINGYEIWCSTDAGATFSIVAVTDNSTISYDDWVRDIGTAVSAVYQIRALNLSNEPSEFSDPASATTRVFSDEELIGMVQEYTFRYFYDYAHPVSGMARERYGSDDVVTTGGSGFGIMALLVGIERGFITRETGITHIQKILTFLESADRFHGVWPHWINGSTGEVIPFGTKDNGGDLVETGFLVQGLLTARQYFNLDNPAELNIASRITTLWETVEWDWYTKNNSGALYWHWSPNYGWEMNMQIRGWNEASIIYMLAIASPTHAIPASYWNSGWAGSSYYRNGGTFYGYKLDVGWDYGGPLFFAHYSFLGLDPRHMKDNFTNYFILNRNHSLIHRAYCIDNPLNHTGYGYDCWGLTASDDPDGYKVHEPTPSRDNGTITPTAALSSMPYTPDESIAALKYFYRQLGQKTWGYYGFYDAFNQRENWWASSYLAIDQGPIIVMMENYRSQLIWNNFMANPEITPMLESIGFVYDPNTIPENSGSGKFLIYPNPGVNGEVNISLSPDKAGPVEIIVTDLSGRIINKIQYNVVSPGLVNIPLNTKSLKPGMYTLTFINQAGENGSEKLLIGPGF
ncbi:MAG: T9SS type A sorting domain-containing protein [Lentimicrobium sp.]|nr:T9SS type A sorting domain-containing protein [Lentimicrobium sp.]